MAKEKPRDRLDKEALRLAGRLSGRAARAARDRIVRRITDNECVYCEKPGRTHSSCLKDHVKDNFHSIEDIKRRRRTHTDDGQNLLGIVYDENGRNITHDVNRDRFDW